MVTFNELNLCVAAAKSGQLDELKLLPEKKRAVGRNHLHVRGVWRTFRGASVGARERMCVERDHDHGSGAERTSRCVCLGGRERLPPPRDAAVSEEFDETRDEGEETSYMKRRVQDD